MRIDDLGYFHIQRFLTLQNQGAYFLSRLRYDINLYQFKNGCFEQIDLVKLKRKMFQGEQRSIIAFVGKNEKMKVRVVIEKVPQQIASEKRRKLKQICDDKGKFVSKKRLDLCALNTYLTNANENQLPTKDIRKYYSLRWQIELVFKAWKSTYNIDKIKKMKLERFECLTYGTLILIVLTTHLLAYYKSVLFIKFNKEISDLKFYKILKFHMNKIKIALQESKSKLLSLINKLDKIIMLTCSKELKYLNEAPLQILKITSLA